MSAPTSSSSYWALLRAKGFAPFFYSQILTNLGDGLLSVSLIYYAVSIGSSAAALGVLVSAITLARGLLGPLGGLMSDRMDRRRYVITLEVMRAVAVLCIPMLGMMDMLNVWGLAIIGVFISTLFAISVPAAKALIPELISTNRLQLANGLIQTITWPAFFLGAGALALFQGRYPPSTLFAVIGIAFAISSMLLWFLPRMGNTPAPKERLTILVFFKELISGYQALRVDRVMRARVWLYGVFTFFWRGALQICIPLLILRHFESPQWIYGALMFANGAAELLSNLYVGKAYFRRPIVFTYSCEILMGVGLLLMAASLYLPLPYIWLFPSVILVGIGAATIDIPLLTVIQKQVAAEHTGKVISYWFTIGSCGGAAGSLLLGILFNYLPIGIAMLMTGGICLGIGLLFFWWAWKHNTFINEPPDERLVITESV